MTGLNKDTVISIQINFKEKISRGLCVIYLRRPGVASGLNNGTCAVLNFSDHFKFYSFNVPVKPVYKIIF